MVRGIAELPACSFLRRGVADKSHELIVPGRALLRVEVMTI